MTHDDFIDSIAYFFENHTHQISVLGDDFHTTLSHEIELQKEKIKKVCSNVADFLPSEALEKVMEKFAQEMPKILEKSIKLKEKIISTVQHEIGQYRAQEKMKIDSACAQLAYCKEGESDWCKWHEVIDNAGFEVVLKSDCLDDTNGITDGSYYKALMIKNTESKEIIIANAGTRVGISNESISDFLDNWQFISGGEISKLKQAKILFDILMDSLKDEIKDYKIRVIGHSLGAVLTDVIAAYADIELRKCGLRSGQDQITSVTFENPGTKALIEEMYNDEGLSPNLVSQMNMYVFNSSENIINSLKDQIGHVYTVISPDSDLNLGYKKETYTKRSWIGDKIDACYQFIETKCKSLLTSLGIENYSYIDLGKLANTHAIDSFTDIFFGNAVGEIRDESGKIVSLGQIYLENDEVCTENLSKINTYEMQQMIEEFFVEFMKNNMQNIHIT